MSPRLLRHPHAAVVAQALAHQRELRLVRAGDRDAGRVNLRVAGVGEEGAALVRAPGRRDVRVHGVGREVVRRAVAAGAEQHRVRRRSARSRRSIRLRQTMPRAWPLTTTRSSISRLANDLDRAALDLPHHRLVGAEQQLLAGLAARVERARHLRAAERPVVEQAAVLARERHALRDALVDDVHAQLRQPVDVRLARAVVAALDRVVEQPLDAVAVVLVVLRGVDAALRGDAVRAARAVLDAEAQDVVAELAERRRRRRAGEAGADDDDGVLPAVRRVDQLRLEAVAVPLVRQRPARELLASRGMVDARQVSASGNTQIGMSAEAAADDDRQRRCPTRVEPPRVARMIEPERLKRARDAVPQVQADERAWQIT